MSIPALKYPSLTTVTVAYLLCFAAFVLSVKFSCNGISIRKQKKTKQPTLLCKDLLVLSLLMLK